MSFANIWQKKNARTNQNANIWPSTSAFDLPIMWFHIVSRIVTSSWCCLSSSGMVDDKPKSLSSVSCSWSSPRTVENGTGCHDDDIIGVNGNFRLLVESDPGECDASLAPGLPTILRTNARKTELDVHAKPKRRWKKNEVKGAVVGRRLALGGTRLESFLAGGKLDYDEDWRSSTEETWLETKKDKQKPPLCA